MFGCHKILNTIKKLIEKGKAGPAKSIIWKHIGYLRDEVYEDVEYIRDRLIEHYPGALQRTIEKLEGKRYKQALEELEDAKKYLDEAEKFAKKVMELVKG